MATKITIICDICKREILPATQYSKIKTRIYGDIRISDQLPDTEITEDVCMTCQKLIESFTNELKLQLPKSSTVYNFTYELPNWAKKLIEKKKKPKPNFGIEVNNLKLKSQKDITKSLTHERTKPTTERPTKRKK